MTTNEVVTAVQSKWISGFWRRIVAIFVDFLILGLLGFILGLLLSNIFIQMGGWGRLIGFIIALSYFAAMNSKLFNGQTIGKKILKIKVVNSSNEFIPLGKSILRSLVLLIPVFLNGAQFTEAITGSFLIYPISFIIFGGFLASIYLYIFNRTTRQSLHDIAVGTYVANANASIQATEKIWGKHLLLTALIFLVAALAPILTPKLIEDKSYKNLSIAQSAVMKNTNVSSASVFSGWTTFNSSTNKDSKTTTYIRIQALLKTKDIEDKVFAKKLATSAMENIPEAAKVDTIQIILVSGYDIGIWSQSVNYTHVFKPLELL